MIKVKASRTLFTASIEGDIKQFVYDSKRKPSNRELLNYLFNITFADEIKIVSRETFEITLTMPFETFYGFSDVEYTVNQ